MKRIGFVAVALVAALTAGCNRNKDSRAATSGTSAGAVGTAGSKTEVTRRDQDFVHDVAIANMLEMELGRKAVAQSSDSEVKKFAQLEVDDHTKVEDTLSSIAKQHNIAVPTQIDDRHRRKVDKLANRQGNDFDKEYMDTTVDSHEDFVDKLEPRIDKETLTEWKAEVADRLSGKKSQERGQVVAVLPEKSDNAVTTALNQWAADTYPIVQAHLDAARVLDTAVKKAGRTPTN